jgi:DNA-directed RNA polymerase specialized sigma24 family protein
MHFPTTRWTLLADATLNEGQGGCRALEALCASYRQPILSHLATRGYSENESEDLVQEFFLRWLRSRSWKRADAGQGRFRTFLLVCVHHMLAHHHQARCALKRGGRCEVVSLDQLMMSGWDVVYEQREADVNFDRAWAINLVSKTLHMLEMEYADRRREVEFAVLRRFLPSGGGVMPLEQAAEQMGMNLVAVKSALCRLAAGFVSCCAAWLQRQFLRLMRLMRSFAISIQLSRRMS